MEPPPGYGPATRRRATHHPATGHPATGRRGTARLSPARVRISAAEALKPGVIPLRPLTLSDIFNGAVGYIRANPKATLGLTTIVVVITQIIALILQVGPAGALTGKLGVAARRGGSTRGDRSARRCPALPAGWPPALAAILLSGMLTVIVGRAVFGSHDHHRRSVAAEVRGRLLAAARPERCWKSLPRLLLVGLVVVIIVGVAVAANGAAAVLVGIPLVLGLIVALVYLYTMLSFAPVLIVLERLPVMAAITRSFALVRNHFWRVLGIRLLAALVARSSPVRSSVPFSIGGQVLLLGADVHRDRSCSAPTLGVHRRGDRPDHHRAVHRRCRRAALHRPPDPRRGIRPGAADRRRRRARRHRVHRPPLADPAR